MPVASVQSPSWPSHRESTWRDPALVVLLAGLSVVLAAHFELNETLYAFTRRAEFLQLDEWPVGMLVLVIGLVWLSWKRHRRAHQEWQARGFTEATLASVLAENRRLAQENLRLQETERKHLARELHDELGQHLNAIKLDAVMILEGASAGSPVTAHAGAIVRSVDYLHGAVTHMIGRLRPAGLDELGLTAAIEHCLDHWRERLPATRFQLSVSGDWDHLGETVNLTVYRMIQECLMNVYKHAHAHRVNVDLARMPGGPTGREDLRLTVVDDGQGMEPNLPTSRFGVSGMRERVAMLGGTLTLDSAPGRGVRLEALFSAPRDPS